MSHQSHHFTYHSELVPLLRLAWPVVVAELGWMGMGITDTIMVGRLGAEAIGAVALANLVFYTIGLLIIGVLLGLDTLIAQAVGANDLPDAHHSFRQGFWLALGAAPFLLAAMLLCLPALRFLGAEPEVFRLTQPFGRVLALSIFPLGAYTVLRRYLQARSWVRPVMFALVSANLVNVGLNWLLIEGNAGFPALGIEGCAWATVGARLYLALFLLLALLGHEPASSGLWRLEGPDFKRLRQLLTLGLPAAGHIFLEVSGFAAATALAGTFPAVSLAAHEITLNHAALTYMVPLGISSAAAVQVGNAIGAGEPLRARAAGNAAILVGATFMLLSAILLFAFPQIILGFYTSNRAILAAAIPIVFWAGAFQLFDGIQSVATGALRGRGDTQTPFLAGLAGYWVLSLPLGAFLCFRLGYGVPGLWIGLALGLATVALILLHRWLRSG
ncbi:MAG: MATE family efflux transporter [Bryobacter sp.]|nr:MATE family efflux transporter [Bryobacter sp.]